jgi:hypothetical protein
VRKRSNERLAAVYPSFKLDHEEQIKASKILSRFRERGEFEAKNLKAIAPGEGSGESNSRALPYCAFLRMLVYGLG